jgi:hypothetical protein
MVVPAHSPSVDRKQRKQFGSFYRELLDPGGIHLSRYWEV